MPKAVGRCRSRCRQKACDFAVAQPQQWELFSLNDPRQKGFLFAIRTSKREMEMLMFQRRTVIGRSLGLSRIPFNKPAIPRLVAKKNARAKQCLANRKQPSPPFNPCSEESSYYYA